MITVFRNFSRSKWAVGLLGLVAIALLFTGGQQMDVIGALQPPKVIDAGSRSIDATEFRQLIEQARYGQQQQTGQAPSVEQLADEPGFAASLSQRANQLAFLAWADRVGIRPGRELVLREIRKVERFFDPVTRQFSEELYQQVLGEARMTPEMLEEQMRDQYTLLHYATAMETGARLPRIYGAVVANQTQQTRDGRWFTVTQAMAGTAGAPTDQQLTAFMSQNAAQLRRPELRRASVIAFDNPADMQAEISEEKIQQRFDFRRDSLAAPEKRTFVTLTAPNREAATRIATALRSGQAPAAVASANNIQPATYNETPRAAIGDPAVAAAVFGLAANQVSDPIQASVGFVVARVSAITPGSAATLDTVRPQIVAELREAEAKAKVFQRVEAYEAARRAGKSADAAVQEVGGRFIALPPLTREGKTPDGQQINLPPAMLQNILRLPANGVSEVATLDDGMYYAVRVDEILPSAMPNLADVRPQLAAAWTARENARLLTAKTDELTGRLRQGQDIAAVAASVGATLNTQRGVGQTQETAQQFGQETLAGLFSTAKGQPFSQPLQAGGMVVGRVDNIYAATPALAAPEAVGWRERMQGQIGQTFLQSVVENAARRAKAAFHEDQARTALGLEPRTAPAAGGPVQVPTKS